MKKKLLVCAIIALCLSIIAYGTTAYFTYEGKATNIISTSGVEVTIEELSLNDNGELFPFVNVMGVMPSAEVSKIVLINNSGEQPVWVRVSVDKAINLAKGVVESPDLSLISLDINTTDWTEADGYYYYNNKLDPGETTAPLFTKVTFSNEMGNMYQNSECVIDIIAQATQTAHNGETVFEADGWPKKQ